MSALPAHAMLYSDDNASPSSEDLEYYDEIDDMDDMDDITAVEEADYVLCVDAANILPQDDLTTQAGKFFILINNAVAHIQMRQTIAGPSVDSDYQDLLWLGIRNLALIMRLGNKTAHALAAQLVIRRTKNPVVPHTLMDTRIFVYNSLTRSIKDYAQHEKNAESLWRDQLYQFGERSGQEDMCAMALLIKADRLGSIDMNDNAVFEAKKQWILNKMMGVTR